MAEQPEPQALTVGTVEHGYDARPEPRARGGLSPNQRRFLALRPLHANDSECAEASGVHPSRIPAWKRENPEFRTAYDALWEEVERFAETERRRLLGKALLTADAAMDAVTLVMTRQGAVVKDDEGAPVLIPDHTARLKGGEQVLRANGLWNPQQAGATGNDTLTGFMSRMADIIEGKTTQAAPIIEATARTVDHADANADDDQRQP